MRLQAPHPHDLPAKPLPALPGLESLVRPGHQPL